MTIAELLSNEELRRFEFPVVTKKIFLGHGGVCPLPRRVAERIAHVSLNCTEDDQEAAVGPTFLSETRVVAGKFLGVNAEEIAFVGPTSLGLSLIANGIRYRKGDNIIVYMDDYPSNVYPWMALAEKGVQVRLLNIRELGRIRNIDIIGQVDEQTRLVALASCHFLSGWRIDIQEIGAFLQERNIRFSLDAIQTLGAFPTPLNRVDFMAADAHKWMLGPCGAGLMYVRREVQDKLIPSVWGWHNVKSPNFVTQDKIEFRSDARRYEAGSAMLLGVAAMKASMELIMELGVDAIAAELLRKRAWVVPALEAKGYEVLQSKAAPQHASGIITFHKPGTDLVALHQKLAAAQIVTSLRNDREGNRYIRLSPHFYNTDDELHRTLELL